MQAGVDEVGRGCLAGPVVAAAVVLFNEVEGLKDSKQLTPIKRNRLCDEILENGIAGIGISSNVEVDEINIHQASLLAMERFISWHAPPPAESGNLEALTTAKHGRIPRLRPLFIPMLRLWCST